MNGPMAKAIGMLMAIGMATAILLPGRQTVPVIGAVQRLFSGSAHTVITGSA